MWSVLFCVIIALVVVKISHWLYRWSNPYCAGKLPPGSMGLPIIGETLDFLKPHAFYEIHPFIKKRMSRHGSLFRTSIFGSNTVVSSDAEVNFEILKQENKYFALGYPDGFIKMFGKDNLFFKQGSFHKYVKQITLQLLGTEGLKRRFIHDMDRATREQLKLKANEGIFCVKDAATELIIGNLIPKMMSDIRPETKSRLTKNFKAFNFDFFGSFLSVAAWKAVYKVLKARREAVHMIKDILLNRREKSSENNGDFVDTMLQEVEKQGTILDEEAAINLIYFLSVIAHETTSVAIAVAVKFISENPKVLAELKREHETILQSRTDKEAGVSWDEYRSKMRYTHMVISESVRLGNMAPVVFRTVVNDVEIKGYTIPKGWIVAVAPSVLHYDPEKYENPLEFNPSRWEGKEVLSGSKTFMAFGGGARLCAGAEFARLQMALFLHHLVINYNFSLVEEGGNITRRPHIQFSKGMRITISESCG